MRPPSTPRLLCLALAAGNAPLVHAGLSAAQITSDLKADAGPLGCNAVLCKTIAYVIGDIGRLIGEVVSDYTLAQVYAVGHPNAEEVNTYGRSPPVYPSPNATSEGGWDAAYSQAKSLVAQMTLTGKIGVALGSSNTQGCSGFTGDVSRLGFPGMCLNDAESGVRTGKLVSGFPGQLHIGASWNRTLAYSRAQALGREFKAKGVNVLLGPVVGPLGRIAKGGRNWEGFSNDPYLAGEMVAPTVEGIQESVIACIKHLIGNEQESNRSPFLTGFLPGFANTSVSSNIDDRTMHEAYLWPFYDAIHAEAGAVMCSYNKVNGSYACQNSKVINGLLKTELGFQGFVVSDWYAQHTGTASVNAGLDMTMPMSQKMPEPQYAMAVTNGSISESRLDDVATRILASWYRYAQLQDPGLTANQDVNAQDPAAASILFQAAVEGHVLVKNVGNTLPLKKPAVLSLFGYDAIGGTNTTGQLGDYGLANMQAYEDGRMFGDLDFYPMMAEIPPAGTSGPDVCLNGTMIGGGGSGAITPTYTYSPYDGFVQQAAVDGTRLYTDFTSVNPRLNSSGYPCIVFINSASSESWDRSHIFSEYNDQLVTNVANACKQTVVVMHNAGTVVVDSWIDHPNVTAVILAHLPGQESGLALTEIMYGRQSPSGRLPYTVAKSEADWGSLLGPTLPNPSDPYYAQSNFDEGLYIDYKSFIQRNVSPRFPFGFGLTYSNFSYSDLSVTKNSSANLNPLPYDSGSGVAPQGGLASLYDNVAEVTATIKNVGNVTAAEVAQLYLAIPGSGLPKVLRGFEKTLLGPGQTATVSFPLRRRDVSVWDVGEQQWRLAEGAVGVMVGKDVLDIQLQGTLEM